MGQYEVNLKERIVKAIGILKQKFPECDICVGGSACLYLRGIDYKIPRDIDIIILNDISDEEYRKYKGKMMMCAFDECRVHFDVLYKWIDTYYDVITLNDESIKVAKPICYLKSKEFFSVNPEFPECVQKHNRRGLDELRKFLTDNNLI